MFTVGLSLESECLPHVKMKVLAYVKGSKRDWDQSKLENTKYKLFQCMSKFIFIYIYKGVFREFGMQLFSLCQEARRYGATFPHS